MTNQQRTSEKRKEQLNNAQKAYKKRKLDYEEKLYEQIQKIENFSEKLNQLEKKIEQGFRKIQGSMEKGIQEIKKFSNPEKEKEERKKELKEKEKIIKEKREKRTAVNIFRKWKNLTREKVQEKDRKSWEEYEYHENITWPKIKSMMKQKELDKEILELANDQKENRLWYLEEKQWTGEEMVQEINTQEFGIREEDLADILLMINSSGTP